MIFPCSVNAETGDQPTQDVLSSQRCEAEEDSVVVLDSRYYLDEPLHFDIQSTGQKSHCVNITL